MHGLLTQGDKNKEAVAQKWNNVAGEAFDSYDFFSFFYGWIVAIQDGFKSDSASNCFYAAFATV